jgi:hypothetical protein
MQVDVTGQMSLLSSGLLPRGVLPLSSPGWVMATP